MIRVIFLAQLREQLDVSEIEISNAQINTLDDVKKQLVTQNPKWEAALLNTRVLAAVNHAYAKGHQQLADGDEVAFFLPVTGG